MQPDVIPIRPGLRLRKAAPADARTALPWYQDPEILRLLDGRHAPEPYPLERVVAMYEYLMGVGEAYMIEVEEEGRWREIGDVTLGRETLPITIGEKRYWGRGIGRLVIGALVARARELGWPRLAVKEVHAGNVRSYRLFRSCGFREVGREDDGVAMELVLSVHS